MVLLKKILNRIAFNDEVLISYDEYDQHGYEAQKLLDLGILIREETNNGRCGDCRSWSEMHKLPNGSYYIVCSSCEDGGMQVVDIEKCVVYRFNLAVLLNKMKQDLFGSQGNVQERIQNDMWSLDVHDIHGVQRSVYFLRRADDVRGGVFTHLRSRSSLDPVIIAVDNLATSLAESDFQIVYLESFLVDGEEGLFSSRLFLRQFSASVEAGASDAVYLDQNKIAIEDKCIRHNVDAHRGYKDEIAVSSLKELMIPSTSPEWRKDINRRYIYISPSYEIAVLLPLKLTSADIKGKTDDEIFSKYPKFIQALKEIDDEAQMSIEHIVVKENVEFPPFGRKMLVIKEIAINVSKSEKIETFYIGRAYPMVLKK